MGKQKRLTPAQIRKQQLVVEGMMYRSRILDSKQAVKSSRVVEWFVDDGIERTTEAASSWVGMLLRYRSLMPVALSGASLVARWVWRKPLLYSSLIVSGLGLYARSKAKKSDEETKETAE